MPTTKQHTESGIIGFSVEVRPTRDYQGVGTTVDYVFANPVGEADVYGPHAEIAGLAHELANAKLDQLLAETEAQKQGEIERQVKTQTAGGGAQQPPATKTKVGTPEPPEGQPVEWQQVSKPNGRGTLRFRPVSNLNTDTFKALVVEAIKASGADPELHQVWDERPKLEKDGKGYSICNVRPTEDNPAFAFNTNDKGYQNNSFFVDFNDDGTVRVKPSDKYLTAAKSAQVAQQQAAPPPSDDDLPF